MLSVHAALPCPQSREEFIDRSRRRHFGVGQAHAGKRVRVAAGNRDFSEARRKSRSALICPPPHLPIARLVSRHVGFPPAKVFFFTPPGQTRERVIDAEEELSLGEIHEQGNEVASTALNLKVVSLGEAVNSEMHLRPAGHLNGNLFTQEKVWVTPQNFRGFNGVMFRDRNDGHSHPLQPVVDLVGLAVGLPANAGYPRSTKHSGSDRVNVKVAAHGSMVGFEYEQPVKALQNLNECAHGTY